MAYRLGPRARRVYLVLRDRIARGDWLPGSKLPAHRDLAAALGVAAMTIRQVLGQLEEQGLISRQPVARTPEVDTGDELKDTSPRGC